MTDPNQAKLSVVKALFGITTAGHTTTVPTPLLEQLNHDAQELATLLADALALLRRASEALTVEPLRSDVAAFLGELEAKEAAK